MLDPLLPPEGLAEPNRGREKVVSKRCLRDIGRDYGLCRKRDDIIAHECLRPLSPEGKGQPFSIWRFKDDMRLKLGDVFPCNVDHPPELARQPYCFEVTLRLCHGWGSNIEQESEQEDNEVFHTAAFQTSRYNCPVIYSSLGPLLVRTPVH